MPFISSTEVRAKAAKAYPRFLKQWIRGAGGDFFPYRVRARLSVDAGEPRATIAASHRLLADSKAERGWGYTVHRKQIKTRDFGNNLVPQAITIDTPDDLLRLAGKVREFAATSAVVARIRGELPGLEEWLVSNVNSLDQLASSLEGLISVTQWFLAHPWPDCYGRQIPVSVDTKFIDRHQALLRQWLDLLLPPAAIDVNETRFARRFGLRDGQPHRALRLLDASLMSELNLPFDELSLPLRQLARIRLHDATVFIVENNLNLLTLPKVSRGIAIRGEGSAVNRLECLDWLQTNRVIYWGDIDVEGFQILSRLRNLVPHVESIMMDRPTLESHADFVVAGNAATVSMPTNLTPAEGDAFKWCLENNARLEQEKIWQCFAEQMVVAMTQNQVHTDCPA